MGQGRHEGACECQTAERTWQAVGCLQVALPAVWRMGLPGAEAAAVAGLYLLLFHVKASV